MSRALRRIWARRAWLGLLLFLVLPVWASTLPPRFSLGKVAETWSAQKNGLVLDWRVQRYEGGAPVGQPLSGTLSLRRGQVRAESGEGDTREVRIFDNSHGGALVAGRYTPLAEDTQLSLPEGLFLRGAENLWELAEAYGVDFAQASWGRMPVDDPEILFRPVVRYGAPAGKDDLSLPQLWIEPHRFRIHRVIAREGDHVLRVDYAGHGAVSKDLGWLPATLAVYLDERPLWTARITGVASGAPPTDKTFSLSALEAEATR